MESRPSSGIAKDPSRDATKWRVLRMVSLCLVVAAVHAGALGMYFAADDITFLARADSPLRLEDFPIRWISGPLAWKLQRILFGLDPLPYNITRLLLHGLVVLGVYQVGKRLSLSRAGAWCAAVFFGTSPVVFTPLHWASGQGEILCAGFVLLAAFWSLETSERPTIHAEVAIATSAIAAMLCKETAALLPIPLLLLRDRTRESARGTRVPFPGTGPLVVIAATFALAIALWRSPHVGGEAYAVDTGVAHLFQNLMTYLAWGTGLGGVIPDRVAAVDPTLWPKGLAVALALLAIAMSARGGWKSSARFGLSWFLVFLLPVLPLAHHSYLYYLYLPWIGVCWAVAWAVERTLEVRANRLTMPGLVLMGLLAAAIGARSIAAREQAVANGLPLDRTIREGMLTRNGIEGLKSLELGSPDSIGYVNPYPRMFQNIASNDPTLRAAPSGQTYTPFEAAMRGGETLALFYPNVRSLGFATQPRSEWGAALILLHENDGTLHPLGRGTVALERFGEEAIGIEQWPLAEDAFRRVLAQGDPTADAVHGLVYSLAGQSRDREAVELARDFVRRWPQDPRADALRQWLESEAKAR